MTPRSVLVALIVGVSLPSALVAGILLGRSEPPTSRPVVVQLATRSPAPTPQPLPTRDPVQAPLQDAAANRVLELLQQVAQGKDPYEVSSQLDSSLTIAACPYGCSRTPRLAAFTPRMPLNWTPVELILVSSSDPDTVTLRAPLSGTKAIIGSSGTPTQQPLTGHITVEVSREYGPTWEPTRFYLDPLLVPETRPATLPSSTPTSIVTDPRTGLQLPGSTPERETVEEHERLANEVLQSISTLAAGSPLPYQYAPEVETQIREIVSRFAPPGARMTGLSLESVEWERVEVRDEDTLELVGPDDTAAMVGYLNGTVWLQDTQGNRKPLSLDPTSEHLVVNLHRRSGAWVVTNVSDGKVDTHSPEEVNTP